MGAPHCGQPISTQLVKLIPSLALIATVAHSATEAPLATCQQEGRTQATGSQQQVEAAGSVWWRYQYVDELLGGRAFKVINKERSMDERLANIQHTAVALRFADIDVFRYDSGDPAADERNKDLVAGPQVDANRCNGQLREMLAQLEEIKQIIESQRQNKTGGDRLEERHLLLGRVLDSFGRYESGMLLGRSFLLGAHSQCISSHLLLASGHQQERPVPTKFCWARLAIGKHLSPSLKGPTWNSRSEVISTAVCLPEACHSKTFAESLSANRKLLQQLLATQFSLPEALYMDQQLELDSVYCMPDSTSAFRMPLTGRLLVGLTIGWILLALYATFCQRQDNRLLQSLHLGSSWRDLIELYDDQDDDNNSERPPTAKGHRAAETSRPRIDLDALNFIKVGLCVIVVYAHAFVFRAATASDMLRIVSMSENDPIYLATIYSSTVVDISFVITGLLVGLSIMRQANRKPAKDDKDKDRGEQKSSSSSNGSKRLAAAINQLAQFSKGWLKVALARHLRLSPLFLLVFAFQKGLMSYLFSAWPLWDAGFKRETPFGACRDESWLVPFTFKSSLQPLCRQCLPQSWSISNDLFFSIAGTPVALLMVCRPRLALAIGVALTAYSVGANLRHFAGLPYEDRVDLSDFRSYGLAKFFSHYSNIYTYPHMRFGTFLTGLLAGYLLFKFDLQLDNWKEWPKWISGVLTKAAIGIILISPTFITQIATIRPLIKPYHRLFMPIMFAFGRTTLAAANAVIILRIATDWKDKLWVRSFNNKFMRVMAKLNFAILLVHMNFIWIEVGAQTSAGLFSGLTLFASFASAYLLSIATAICLYVIYERPVEKIMKVFVLPKLQSI